MPGTNYGAAWPEGKESSAGRGISAAGFSSPCPRYVAAAGALAGDGAAPAVLNLVAA